jgi:NTP pyrophosphatase (non-canonical NTP hydrolase)
MEANKYQELASMTESPSGRKTLDRHMQNARVYNFNIQKLFDCLAECDFDKLKRDIYYGEAGESLASSEETNELRLLHGVLGLITEEFELLELIREQDRLDPVHLKEELGDLLWYISLIASSQGITLKDVMESNIRKLALRNRNKGKFDLAGTLERSLDKEREVLEGKEGKELSQKQLEQLRGYNSEKLTEDIGCANMIQRKYEG